MERYIEFLNINNNHNPLDCQRSSEYCSHVEGEQRVEPLIYQQKRKHRTEYRTKHSIKHSIKYPPLS